jgi:hypothetical protein
MTSILIYIPSHSDYLLAKENITRIKDDFYKSCFSSSFQIIFSLSINGVSIIKNELIELESLVDRFSYTPKNIGADTNILQGYTHALEIRPDYFWIVSANEFIVPKAIDYLCRIISDHPDSDLFIANADNRFREIRINNLFLDFIKKESSIGLITSTIYKFSSTHAFYPLAFNWKWTGWGQLVVIQSILNSDGFLGIVEYPDKKLFTQPYSYTNRIGLRLDESIRRNYHHSFFSYPIVAAHFISKNKQDYNYFIYNWLKTSWFHINTFRFKKNINFNNSHFGINPLELESLFFHSIKNINFFAFLLVKFFYILPIRKFRDSSNLNYLYKILKKRWKIS